MTSSSKSVRAIASRAVAARSRASAAAMFPWLRLLNGNGIETPTRNAWSLLSSNRRTPADIAGSGMPKERSRAIAASAASRSARAIWRRKAEGEASSVAGGSISGNTEGTSAAGAASPQSAASAFLAALSAARAASSSASASASAASARSDRRGGSRPTSTSTPAILASSRLRSTMSRASSNRAAAATAST